MKNISRQFDRSVWLDWHGIAQPVPQALRRVATTFVTLQEERHTADYDNHVQWTITDVEPILKAAEAAFQVWLSIRADPMAGNYLLAMLLGKQR